jgi:hypothetical protein
VVIHGGRHPRRWRLYGGISVRRRGRTSFFAAHSITPKVNWNTHFYDFADAVYVLPNNAAPQNTVLLFMYVISQTIHEININI